MSCFTKCGKWQNFRHQLCILMVHQPPKRPWKMLLEAGNSINTGVWRYFSLRQNLESAGGLKEGARHRLQHPGWDFANKQVPQSHWEGNFLPFQWEKAEEEMLMCWTCGAIPTGQRLMASKELSTRNGAERVKIGAAGSILIIQTEILIMRIANEVFELFGWTPRSSSFPPCRSANGTKPKDWIVMGEK